MKKIISLSLSLITVAIMYGQSIENEFKNADNLLKQKNYNEAIQELNNAIAKIENEQLNSMIADLLPDKILDYSKINSVENPELSRSYISGNLIVINQVYSKPLNNSQEEISESYIENMNSLVTIGITNAPEKMCEIANIHAMNNSENSGMELLSPILFNEYRAVKLFNSVEKQANLAILAGGAVVEIKAENIETEKQLFEVANTIDLDKVVRYFGK
jgi:hypothetical protein